jgi:DNA-binding SARP family transcriptional activator/tetratricopeptide (TPR) repeat protein
MHLHLAKAVMEFRVLGPLVMHVGGRMVELGGAKHRMLLALFLFRANEPISFDFLIDALWGEAPPERARNSLHVHVSRLRKVLPPGRIKTSQSAYSLVVESGELDLVQFRTLVKDARRSHAAGDAGAASELFSEALALWRGSPLPELAGSASFTSEIASLEEERLSAVEDRIVADLELGRHFEVVSELESLVAAHPLRERLVAHSMLALYRCGRQADALEAYRSARRGLVEELGLEPGRLLNELQQGILLHDPALDPLPVERRPSPARPSRRRVTLLLAGLSLPSRVDPEVAGRVLARGREAVRNVLMRHGAVVEEPLGDVVVGAFGLPAVHEDDALRALRAAAELSQALAPMRLELRVAIDSGEVLATDDRLVDDQIAGWMMKLKETARDGATIIGEGARRLVRGAVKLRESGVAGAWNVVDFDPTAELIERHFDAPLVGREAEIERLREAFTWVVGTRSSHLVTVLGPAGIGKSRLARELGDILSGEATVLVGRCLAYGSGAFLPLVEVVKQAAGDTSPAAIERLFEGVDDARLVVDQLTAALGTGERTSAEDAFWAFRRLFAALARDRPLVLVLEDLHWAEGRLLDFVEELVVRGEDSAILVLCLARPELLEQRPSWGGGGLDAESIRLEALSQESSELLIRPLEQDVSQEARARILDRAEGNPLFIEQMVALLKEDPEAVDEGIPPSIQSVLAARLDRLATDERALLERASIVGLEFSLAGVTGLSPEDERPGLAEVTRRLVRKELVRPAEPEIRGEERFRFRHILIRDVAYDSVLKSVRAELHERFASLVDEGSDRAGELEEIIGYHLERSYELRKELDPEAGELVQLAAEAGAHLSAAGGKELDRSDMPAGIDLLLRGLRLLPVDDPSRGDALAALAYAFRLTGRWELAREYLDYGFDHADQRKHIALREYLTVSRLQLRLHTEPDFSVDEFLREASRSLRCLDAQGADQYAMRVRAILAWPYALRGQMRRAEGLIEAVPPEQDQHLGARKLLPSLWLYGPLPATKAMDLCDALLAEHPAPRTVASCYRCLAALKAMTGQFDEARALLNQDRVILEELGLEVLVAAVSAVGGAVELLAGEPASSEAILRAGMKRLGRLGKTMHFSAVAALLARALYEQKKHNEAWSMMELAARGPHHDVGVAVGWLGIQAKLIAQQAGPDDGVGIAREAVGIAETTDSLDLQGDAFVDLADVLLRAGRLEDGFAALDSAVGFYEKKGNRVSAARARALLRERKV